LGYVDLDFEFMQYLIADLFQVQFTHPADDGLSIYSLHLELDEGIILGDVAEGFLKPLPLVIDPRNDGYELQDGFGRSTRSQCGLMRSAVVYALGSVSKRRFKVTSPEARVGLPNKLPFDPVLAIFPVLFPSSSRTYTTSNVKNRTLTILGKHVFC
jgi:hypothetical protein